MTRETPTVLLIEGGWSGPWVFARLVAALAMRGIVALTLPPVVDDTVCYRPAADSEEGRDRVLRAIGALDGPIVLVGHSGGGFEMTWWGNQPEVAHLVYMSAHLPGSGVRPNSTQWRRHVAVDRDGYSRFATDGARELFFADLAEHEREWAVSTMLPGRAASVPLRSSGEPAFSQKASSYIIFEQDRALLPKDQEAFAAHCQSTYRVSSGHFGFLSQPEAVAEIFQRILRTV